MNNLLTIANGITLVRVVLVPVVALFIARQCWSWAIASFVVIMITDWADGFVARLLHQQSVFGALFDHGADKLLMIVLFIYALCAQAPGFPAWFCFLVLGKELVLLVGALLLLIGRYTPTVAPLLLGKVTMAVQMGVWLWWLCAQTGMVAFPYWPVALVVGLNVALVVIYGYEFIQLLRGV